MKRNALISRMVLLVAIAGLVVTVSAWQDQPQNNPTQQEQRDTIPTKKIKDIDEALEALEKSKLELERTLSEREWEKEMKASMKEVDLNKMQAEINKAMKEVDAVKIQANIENAMKSIDMEKISMELQEAMKEINSEKISAEIAKALKEVDMAKISAEVQASVAKIDMEKIKAEMQRIKEIDLSKIEEEMKKIGPEIEKSMAEARESMDQAKKELTAYKGFIDDLDREGLIDKDKAYTIEYKKGELTINGQKQSAGTVSKFNQFLKGHKDFTITKDKDQFNIDND